MKKLKVILAMALCAAMVIPSGCGNKDKTSDNPVQDENLPAKAKIVMYNPGGIYQECTDNAAVLAEIKKKFRADTNIDLDIEAIDKPWTGYQDVIALALNSGEQVDSVPIWSSEAMKHISNGSIAPMDELLKKYGPNIKKVLPEDVWKFTEVNGKIYGLPRIAPEKRQGVMIRTDWLEKCGLKMPKNLEELEAAAKTFKEKDPAGAGKTIPILVSDLVPTQTVGYGVGFVNSMNGFVGFYEKDSKMYQYWGYPEIKKTIDWSRKIYTEGLTTKDYFTLKPADITNRIEQGVVGIWYGKLGDTVSLLSKVRKNFPEAKFDYVPLKNSKGEIVYQKGPLSSDFIMIPESSKNKEVVMKYYDWTLASKENYMLVNYGIEGKNYKKEGEKVKLLGELRADGWTYKDYNGFYSGMFDMIGLMGYGKNEACGVVPKIFSDAVLQKIYDTEQDPMIKRFDKEKWIIPNNYGFTPKLDGIAQQTKSTRETNLWNATSKYVAGTTDWAEVQKALDNYFKGPGGPEEVQQISEQFKPWNDKWNKK